jgi:hypothetical protein
MSNAVSTRPNVQAPKNVRDESSRRRPSFCAGDEIQLADGQTWMLPPPPTISERATMQSESSYNGIIRAILEAEDRSERGLAELAFVIFLLQRNYYLSPADYQRLLDSRMRTTGYSDWQTDFQHIAQQHLNTFVSRSGDLLEN